MPTINDGHIFYHDKLMIEVGLKILRIKSGRALSLVNPKSYHCHFALSVKKYNMRR
jgi:hypothetical protein